MTSIEDKILSALSEVEDPDLKKDLVTLNMIQDLKVDGKNVNFTLVLTTPACPLKDMLTKACHTAIAHLVDDSLNVDINVTSNVESNSSKHAEELNIPGVKNLIAVASGKGGVGKSTVSVNLAIALAQTGSKIGLIDADIYGPSIPIMMGLENVRPEIKKINGKNTMIPLEKHGIKLMSIGFLMPPNQPVIWRGPMASTAMKQLIRDTLWEDIDYMVVDLPPGTGDIQLTISQQFPLDGALLVTSPQAVSVADARKAAGMFLAENITIPVLGVVENMAYFQTDELPDRKFYIFGKDGGSLLADELNVPLLGQIPIEENIREGGDTGNPIALNEKSASCDQWCKLAAGVAQQVSILNAMEPKTIVAKEHNG